MTKKRIVQFAKFCLIGGTALLINLLVTRTGVEVFGLWYFWAYFIGIFFSWTFLFAANAIITFPEHERTRYGHKYIVFLVGYLVISGVNVSLVYALTSLMEIMYLVSIIVATMITTVLTFLFSKRFVYRA